MSISLKPAIPVLLAAAIAFPAATRADTTNLLANPAESGDITGWTAGGTATPTVDSGTFDAGINPHAGRFDFRGSRCRGHADPNHHPRGKPGTHRLANRLGSLKAVVDFFEQGLNQASQSDDAPRGPDFPRRIGQRHQHRRHSGNRFQCGGLAGRTHAFAIPAGTRSISYQMDFIRYVGTDLDGFIDDNSLIVSSAVPEPAGLSLVVMARRPFVPPRSKG